MPILHSCSGIPEITALGGTIGDTVGVLIDKLPGEDASRFVPGTGLSTYCVVGLVTYVKHPA